MDLHDARSRPAEAVEQALVGRAHRAHVHELHEQRGRWPPELGGVLLERGQVLHRSRRVIVDSKAAQAVVSSCRGVRGDTRRS